MVAGSDLSAPRLTVHVRTPGGQLLAEATPRRMFDFNELVNEVLNRVVPLHGEYKEATIECAARDGVPELRLAHAQVARAADGNLGLRIQIEGGQRDSPASDDELEIHFSIDGEFDPNEATAQLGLAPNHAHAGSVGLSTAHRGNTWSMKWGPGRPTDVDALLAALLATVEPRAELVARFCESRHVAATVEFVGYSARSQSLQLSPEQLRSIASIGAGLWYAPYIRPAPLAMGT